MSQTVEQAEAALAAANAAYLSELERDSERSEGSGAQERRREEHQQSLRDKIAQCERDLEEAKRRHIAAAAGKWVHCSPDLLNAGVDCATTPRRACECGSGGHDHFITHASTPSN